MLMRKRKSRQMTALEDLPPQTRENWTGDKSPQGSVEYLTTRHELRAELEKAIEGLPQDYKAIFLMRDVDGLSNQEVAQVLSITVPAVKSRLHRARHALKRKLRKFYSDYKQSDVISYGPAYDSVQGQERLAA